MRAKLKLMFLLTSLLMVAAQASAAYQECTSTVTGNFNGTAIAEGDYDKLMSVLQEAFGGTGQPVPGRSENDPTPLGPGQDVPLSPYSQVIQAYQQAALDATNQSLIPGSERDLVRQYFSQLGEQTGPGPK